MPADLCENCRKTFAELPDNRKDADIIERIHPEGACEQCTLGAGSPGSVGNDELLHRLIVSPRDYDPRSRRIFEEPFYKVFENGLSVCRSVASNGDIENLLVEALTHKPSQDPRQFHVVCQARAQRIREELDSANARLFAIYDQTVTRLNPAEPPVPTHASVFLRLPKPGSEGRKEKQKDYAGRLRDMFVAEQIAVADFRDGAFTALNERAVAGEFTIDTEQESGA